MSEHKTKTFDCVESMRQARERVNAEIDGMSYGELVEWLRGHQYEDSTLQELAEAASQKDESVVKLHAGS